MRSAQVECLSSASYGERPIALYWEEKRLAVETIEARWRHPEGLRFHLRTRDGRLFEARYFEGSDQWTLELLA